MSFNIKCADCKKEITIKDGFNKNEGIIRVYDFGVYTVAIKCINCNNEIVSYPE